MKEPHEQYQVDASVVYIEEGIITRVVGYVWQESIDSLPKIRGYQLACGIYVHKEHLRKATREECLTLARP